MPRTAVAAASLFGAAAAGRLSYASEDKQVTKIIDGVLFPYSKETETEWGTRHLRRHREGRRDHTLMSKGVDIMSRSNAQKRNLHVAELRVHDVIIRPNLLTAAEESFEWIDDDQGVVDIVNIPEVIKHSGLKEQDDAVTTYVYPLNGTSRWSTARSETEIQMKCTGDSSTVCIFSIAQFYCNDGTWVSTSGNLGKLLKMAASDWKETPRQKYLETNQHSCLSDDETTGSCNGAWCGPRYGTNAPHFSKDGRSYCTRVWSKQLRGGESTMIDIHQDMEYTIMFETSGPASEMSSMFDNDWCAKPRHGGGHSGGKAKAKDYCPSNPDE